MATSPCLDRTQPASRVLRHLVASKRSAAVAIEAGTSLLHLAFPGHILVSAAVHAQFLAWHALAPSMTARALPVAVSPAVSGWK